VEKDLNRGTADFSAVSFFVPLNFVANVIIPLEMLKNGIPNIFFMVLSKKILQLVF